VTAQEGLQDTSAAPLQSSVQRASSPRPPPRRARPQSGETWWIQATGGRALLTVEVVEVTDRTVLLMQVADGSVKPKANSVALRYRISDLKWVEKVPS